MKHAALIILAFFAIQPLADGASNSLNREVVMALREARRAQATANVALKLAERIPAVVKGDAGPSGSTGATGPQGDPGQNGAPGVPGQNGSTGIAGAAGTNGSNGATGPQGPQGPAGAPGVSGVKAYGHVSADGSSTSTQGATTTHPGLGIYCMSDNGFSAVTVTPDLWNADAFVLRPGDPHSSCPAGLWDVSVSNNSGVDTGFWFIAN